MFSIYNFLTEFFLDVPTLKIVIVRSLKISAFCILMLVICGVFQVPSEYAVIFYALAIILTSFICSRYTQQRFSSKRQ